MCSISGCLVLHNCEKVQSSKVIKTIRQIMINGEDRGRDSFGIITFGYTGKIREKIKLPSRISEYFKTNDLTKSFKVLINNNRAEPCCEHIKNKTIEDVQPFTSAKQRFYIAHNGTIANDKDLEAKYNLTRSTKIDSAIIPPLLDALWDGKDTTQLIKILQDELIGSYALVIYDVKNPKQIWLATNYKPLFIMKEHGALFFSSLENYLVNKDYNNIYNIRSKIMEVKPYTLLKINEHKIESFDLYKTKTGKKKALVICSAGLDSTVCAKWAQVQGYDISLLHYHYGARANNAEDRQIKLIAKNLNCELVEINTDIFKNVIKHSRLTNPEDEGGLVKTNDGEASAELAWEWVPARNLIFMSIAAGYAEANKFDYIILGGNNEESSSYSDNELIFQKKFNELLPNALNLQNKVEVLVPVANLMKREIVKLGLDIKAPLHLTWSCYEDGDVHCGMCGPCLMRRVGFKMNKIKDMIPYKDLPKDFWEDM